MANITPRRNKDGEIISYGIKVYRGRSSDGKQLKPYTATYKVDQDKTEKQNQKALAKFVFEFEERCKMGVVSDNRQTFEEYAKYVIELKKASGKKISTIEWYNDILQIVSPHIGHMKITEIRPQHLNKLYIEFAKPQYKREKSSAVLKKDLAELLRKKKLSFKELARRSGVGATTVSAIVHGDSVRLDTAEKVSAALGVSVKNFFKVSECTQALSNTTINGYHSFISSVLSQADKESLILFNPASKATAPPPDNKPANYFQIEEVQRILSALDTLPIKWKAIIHLLLISGARRGEIVGLKWNCIDWKNRGIHLKSNILYDPKHGTYEDTTKTESSTHFIKLPAETMELLKQYRSWYLSQRLMYGDLWNDTGFLFFQEKKTSNIGKPMNPDTITSYCADFSKKYNLPHINPHAFRHTMASILFFNGADSVSISKRLGHSKVSTTTDIYSHIIQKADERSAECIADVILRPDKIKQA